MATCARDAFAADPFDRLAGPEARTLLLFFVSSDCPVSNRYFPEMERLQRAFAGSGVHTLYVYANSGEEAEAVRRHQLEFGAPADEGVLDRAGDLVRSVNATTTPEAALLERTGNGWRVVYLGRIDDRYVHIGLERPVAEHHDLERALQAATHGKPVPGPGGPPVGCSIMVNRTPALTTTPAGGMSHARQP